MAILFIKFPKVKGSLAVNTSIRYKNRARNESKPTNIKTKYFRFSFFILLGVKILYEKYNHKTNRDELLYLQDEIKTFA